MLTLFQYSPPEKAGDLKISRLAHPGAENLVLPLWIELDITTYAPARDCPLERVHSFLRPSFPPVNGLGHAFRHGSFHAVKWVPVEMEWIETREDLYYFWRPAPRNLIDHLKKGLGCWNASATCIRRSRSASLTAILNKS